MTSSVAMVVMMVEVAAAAAVGLPLFCSNKHEAGLGLL